ncbi:MAG: apolipoprotein N-acyltransferase [Deltaproteobacteria bacterium]|nr:apolipoprotein N-acyltransferase [Deltaproteobacteria bacterium]
MNGLARWKPIAALASGLLLVAAFPIHPLRLLAWVGLAPLLVALAGEPWRRRLLLGWIAGLGLYLGGLYWLVETMHHFGGLPLAASILGHVLLSAFLALYVAVFAALSAPLGLERGWGVWGLAALWVTLEYLRSFVFTGFPWLTLGYSQVGFLPMVQIADVTGIYGVSFVLVASSAAVAAAWCSWTGGRAVPFAHLVGVVLTAASMRAYGLVRLAATPSSGDPVRIGLLQGNIPQDQKWDEEFRTRTIETYQRLAQRSAESPLDLLVLPETSMPFFFQRGGAWAEQARDLARLNRVPVLLGAPAYRLKEGVDAPAPGARLTAQDIESLNRAYLLDPDGRELAHYDKMHLVPFGEWSPFPFLEKIVAGVGNFHPGRVHTNFDAGSGIRFAVLICYEAIFPAEARAAVLEGARLLVSITNDAWFGRFGAPWQHLEMAQVRAIESRVWLARAANTGVSTFIDPWGRRVSETGLFAEATLEGEVHMGPVLQSFYLRYGDAFVCAAGLVVVAVLATRLLDRRPWRAIAGRAARD